MMKTIKSVICLFILAAGSGSVVAAPHYLSQVSIVSTGAPQFFDDGGTTGTFAFGSLFAPVFAQSAPGIVIQGDSSGLGRARAGVGSIGVYSRAAQGLQGGTLQYYANTITTSSRAEFKLDDFIVTPLVAGNTQTFVNLTLRFAVIGQMGNPTTQGSIFDTATLSNFPDEIFASVDTQLYLDIRLRRSDGSYSGLGGGFARILANTTNVGASSSTMITSGAFVGKEAALQGVTPFLVEAPFIGVPVNELLELTVGFRSVADSAVGFPQGGGLWLGFGSVEFDQTLTFANNVATLPAGFTLNSPGGNIANNVWTPAAVPLPGTLLLMASAMMGLLWGRLQKWHRSLASTSLLIWMASARSGIGGGVSQQASTSRRAANSSRTQAQARSAQGSDLGYESAMGVHSRFRLLAIVLAALGSPLPAVAASLDINGNAAATNDPAGIDELSVTATVGALSGRVSASGASTTSGGGLASAQATATADYGRLAVQSSGQVAGPFDAFPFGGGLAQGGLSSSWTDQFTINAANPALVNQLGSVVFQIQVSGLLSADAGVGATLSLTRAGYGVQVDASSDACDARCATIRSGEVYDFGSQGGGAGFQGDPIGTFAANPVFFIFGMPVDLTVTLSAGVQSSAQFETVTSSASADLGSTLLWGGFLEVRDSVGTPVAAYSVTSDSGVDWSQPVAAVPLPPSVLGFGTGLLALLMQRFRRRKHLPACATGMLREQSL